MGGTGPQMFGSLAGVTAVLNQLWGPAERGKGFGCPGLGAHPTELSALPAALPAVPVQTAGAKKHSLGAEPLMAVPGCASAVGHWGTAQGGQAAAPAVGWGPGVCRVC